MKKLLISTISIFVFINFAFAQSTQQKVDSLKKEQAKAAQAKKVAGDRVMNNPDDEQLFQAYREARDNFDDVSNKLTKALNEQKAEEEAKAQAKAKAKAETEAKAKAEEQARLEALYKKRFPTFDCAGVGGAVKQYMLEELKKNPNWDIKELFLTEDFKSGYLVEYNLHIKSTSGEKIITVADFRLRTGNDLDDGEVAYMNAIAQAWEWSKDPEKFYLGRKEKIKKDKEIQDYKNAKEKMAKAFKNYYYGYTGQKYKGAVENCETIEFYELEIPTGKKYYKITKGKESTAGYSFGRRRHYNDRYTHWHPTTFYEFYYDVEIVKPGKYFVVKCEDRVDLGASLLSGDTYVDDFRFRLGIKPGRHVIYKEKAVNSDGSRINKLGPNDLLARYHVLKVDLKTLQKLIKSFKISDYM